MLVPLLLCSLISLGFSAPTAEQGDCGGNPACMAGDLERQHFGLGRENDCGGNPACMHGDLERQVHFPGREMDCGGLTPEDCWGRLLTGDSERGNFEACYASCNKKLPCVASCLGHLG